MATSDFGRAFRSARNSGEKTFKWNGKEYTTKLKEEVSKPKSSRGFGSGRSTSKSYDDDTRSALKDLSASRKLPQRTRSPAEMKAEARYNPDELAKESDREAKTDLAIDGLGAMGIIAGGSSLAADAMANKAMRDKLANSAREQLTKRREARTMQQAAKTKALRAADEARNAARSQGMTAREAAQKKLDDALANKQITRGEWGESSDNIDAGLPAFKRGGKVMKQPAKSDGGESPAMVKKEIKFMERKGAPKSMLKHEKAEAKGYKRGGGIEKKGYDEVKRYAKGGMIDGCAKRGKTKGKVK